RIALLKISREHFKGQGWARGETKHTHPSVARYCRKNTRSDEDVFIQCSPENCGHRLVRRLLARGWRYQCGVCGISQWRGQPLRLHLDHLNGVHNDNRVDNLRLLCPNCHSQTSTYCRSKQPARE